MNQDPSTKQPSPGGPSLEELANQVYRPSLVEGNSALKRASAWVTVPTTILTYGTVVGITLFLAQQTEAGKKVLQTVAATLTEDEAEKEAPPPPPPPPAPAPAAPAIARTERVDAPPPPPIDPRQDIVPDVVPTKLPTVDQSAMYAGAGGSTGTGAPGPSLGGASAGPSTGPIVSGAQAGKVVDFDFSQIKIKYQPPAPPYPPLAKIAKVQGTVVVEIVVGPDGVPTKATAIDGPAQLRPTAESYAMNWRFEPAMMNGVAQVARFKLTMPFRLK